MRIALLTASAVLLAVPETPRVAVEPGTKLTKTFENRLELQLEGIEVVFNDEELPAPDEIPDVTIEDDEEIVFVDEYVEVDGGRATTLVRTFETLRDSSTQTFNIPGQDEQTLSTEGESELDGRAVRFEWDEDDEDYTSSFDDDGDEDDDLLDGIDGDSDFLFLLTDEDVEEGDSWTLEASVFSRISSPSGDLKIVSDDDSDDNDEFAESFEDNLVGELEATLVSVEDGVATIEITGEVETEFEIEREVPDDAPDDADTSDGFEFTFDVTATLVWDTEAGHASTFELEADVTMSNSSSRSGGGATLVQTQSFEGTYTASASFD